MFFRFINQSVIMPAKWLRIQPAAMAIAGGKGGTMIMATAAKKHLTLFARSRRAPGAGNATVKAAFAAAAHQTLGVLDRSQRNMTISNAMQNVRGANLKGRRSKSKDPSKRGQPLAQMMGR